MRYTVEITAQADADLRGIYAYIAQTLQSPENAEGQLDRLEGSILGLEQLPRRHFRYKREPWHSRGLRVMPVDHYVVLHLPDDERQTVTVLRVLYGGRDIDAVLRRYGETE